MPGKVFINYRRGDEPGYTQALFQRLEAEFDRSQLFMDVEGGIEPGDDFVRVLEAQVTASDVVLAVIGPRWIDARDDKGQRRLDNPDDFVRIEIASALQQGKRVIPVLVSNAQMPRAEDLPEPLTPLARRHAVRLTHERFLADCHGLAQDVRAALATAEAARRAAAVGTSSTQAMQDGGVGKQPAGEAEARKPSYLVFGLVFVALAALFAWITVSLAGDQDVARLVIVLFSAASLFFFFVGVVALRTRLKQNRQKTIAVPTEKPSGLSG
jgi:hypothetical protein